MHVRWRRRAAQVELWSAAGHEGTAVRSLPSRALSDARADSSTGDSRVKEQKAGKGSVRPEKKMGRKAVI